MALAKTFLAIGIAIILAVFVGYALYVIIPPPQIYPSSDCYTKYDCYSLQAKECDPYYNETAPGFPREKPRQLPTDPSCYTRVENSPAYQECMIQQRQCDDTFKITSPLYTHARLNFYILLLLGLLAVVAGVFITKEGVGSGFIGGGILIILWVLPYTSEYWLNLNKYVKLFALGIVLAVLIYLGYKKFDLAKKN